MPTDPAGELEVVDGMPEGGKIHQLTGIPSAFTPDYAPEEMFEIATNSIKRPGKHKGSRSRTLPLPFSGLDKTATLLIIKRPDIVDVEPRIKPYVDPGHLHRLMQIGSVVFFPSESPGLVHDLNNVNHSPSSMRRQLRVAQTNASWSL